MTTTRRLAAIMAADVAGFSAAMERDEEGTFARVQELRRDVIEPKIAEHLGRLIKTTGDGFLAEFASPIAATRCALAIQGELATAPLKLRIGLNLGDVIVEESGDVYGEGVNIAARLEALADPGGVLISAKVFGEVEGKVEVAFTDRGEQQVKNIARPVRVYAANIGVGAPATAAPDVKPLPLPDKPSIAVLPFQNMSGDPEQEYFADGLVEDIITALSRFKSLFVIARNSSFTYKGRAVDIKQVGRELGVRYVLEGSVRKAGRKVRITGQLIEAATGAHLWADKFDGELEDVFELQDQVAGGIVGAIDPKLIEAEIVRVNRKPTAAVDAYDCFLQGAEYVNQWTGKNNDEALRLFHKAIELDPAYAQAYAYAAFCYGWRNAASGLTATERAEAYHFAREAVRLGADDAFSLSWAAFALGWTFGELADAAALIDKALALNPNLARAWNQSGWIRIWLGNPDLAIEHLARAMRLSPLDAQFHTMESATAGAHLRAGRYAEASLWAERALRDQPNSLDAARLLAVSRALAGDLEKAKQAVQRMLHIAPGRGASAAYKNPHTTPPELAETYRAALRQAGLPE
jgi:adenylate cyclase